MLVGAIRNQIDDVWNDFWSGAAFIEGRLNCKALRAAREPIATLELVPTFRPLRFNNQTSPFSVQDDSPEAWSGS